MEVIGDVNGSPGTFDSSYKIFDTCNTIYFIYFGIHSVHARTSVFGMNTGKFLFYIGI